jgi:hypothetical protein
MSRFSAERYLIHRNLLIFNGCVMRRRGRSGALDVLAEPTICSTPRCGMGADSPLPIRPERTMLLLSPALGVRRTSALVTAKTGWLGD